MNAKKSLGVKKSSNPTYESVEELAEELGISRQMAYKAIRAGEIPHIRLGKRIVIPRQAVADWLRTAAGALKNLGA